LCNGNNSKAKDIVTTTI